MLSAVQLKYSSLPLYYIKLVDLHLSKVLLVDYSEMSLSMYVFIQLCNFVSILWMNIQNVIQNFVHHEFS